MAKPSHRQGGTTSFTTKDEMSGARADQALATRNYYVLPIRENLFISKHRVDWKSLT